MVSARYVFLLVTLLCARFVSSFNRMSSPLIALSRESNRLQFSELAALKRVKAGSAAPIQEPGKSIPDEVASLQCIYDMILVERVSMPETTGAGLFIPRVEGDDKKHVALVLNMPKDYGLESELGRVQPVEDILPFNEGDYIFLKDPWGIGPLDIPVGDRCFSFVKAERVGAVFRK